MSASASWNAAFKRQKPTVNDDVIVDDQYDAAIGWRGGAAGEQTGGAKQTTPCRIDTVNRYDTIAGTNCSLSKTARPRQQQRMKAQAQMLR